MAEKSAISWTRSTFNPWIGCTRIGPGCDHCYAEALDKRANFGKTGPHWGAGVPRFRTSAKNWQAPVQWNVSAMKERSAGKTWKGRLDFWPVFCASLADVFDNEVPAQWRVDLWALIDATPRLSWLIVTKRVGLVGPWIELHGWPANARLLITVCNQQEADRDVPKLLALPVKNGISYEPALGAVDWSLWLAHRYVGPGEDVPCSFCGFRTSGLHHPFAKGLEWVIVGGESTQGAGKARPFDLAWARSTVAQCRAAGVPVFVKQLGDAPFFDIYSARTEALLGRNVIRVKKRGGTDLAEGPEDLRFQEFPT